MHQVTMWKGVLIYRELSPDSAAPLGFMELKREFQLIILIGSLPSV